MKPILFDKNATEFNTNGLGRLDVISCYVVEERNGKYELECTISEDALHANEIELNSIIVAKPNQRSNLQAFRVYKLTKPINKKFTISAQHISYQLSHIPAMPFSIDASPKACENTFKGLKQNAVEDCPFTFTTDVNTVAPYKQMQPASIRSRLGGVTGSVLDQFGGEYEWDNYNVILHKHRGSLTASVSLRYGKNITNIEQEENISTTVTGVVPFWSDSEGQNIVFLPEKVVNSKYANAYPFKRSVPLDLSQEFEEAPTVEKLRQTAVNYIAQNGIGIPTVSIKISFVNLSETEQYKDVAQLQTLALCDLVNVQFEKLGINTTAKIVKTEYDVVKERYKTIEVGSLKSSLAKTITDTSGVVDAAITKAITSTRNATSWMTGSNGYVVAVKNTDGTWKELLFLDKADIEEAKNVLRLNENGIGFSSTGVKGPYLNAWTIDGHLIADFVDGGTLRGVQIVAGGYDNQNGSIKAKNGSGKDVVIINQDGLTAKSGVINGANIAVGGVSNQSGIITMYDDKGEALGYWNNAELNVGNGATKLNKNAVVTKWLDCSSENGEAWFPNGLYINRQGNGKIETRSLAVNTWDNKNGGMIEAYHDGIITITRDLWIGGTLRNSSDRRLKEDIKDLTESVDLIKKLKPVSFRMKNNPEHTKHGFIAQDIKPLSNDGEWDIWAEPDGDIQGICYTELIADIVKVEQEILNRLEKLEENGGINADS